MLLAISENLLKELASVSISSNVHFKNSMSKKTTGMYYIPIQTMKTFIFLLSNEILTYSYHFRESKDNGVIEARLWKSHSFLITYSSKQMKKQILIFRNIWRQAIHHLRRSTSIISETDVQSIRKITAHFGIFIEPLLVDGDWVTVTDGPFEGMKGILFQKLENHGLSN